MLISDSRRLERAEMLTSLRSRRAEMLFSSVIHRTLLVLRSFGNSFRMERWLGMGVAANA